MVSSTGEDGKDDTFVGDTSDIQHLDICVVLLSDPAGGRDQWEDKGGALCSSREEGFVDVLEKQWPGDLLVASHGDLVQRAVLSSRKGVGCPGASGETFIVSHSPAILPLAYSL